MSQVHAPGHRCLLVWVTTTLLAAGLGTWLLPHLVGAIPSLPTAGRFEGWLVLGCEATAVGATGWLWLLVSLVTLEAGGGTSRPRGGVPPAIRRLVLVACGAGLVGGLAGPAYAGPQPSPLAGLPLPDRPTAHAPLHAALPAESAPAAARPAGDAGPTRVIRVASGDSLWSLARADLPEGASTAEIDRCWREIHAANRGVIGADPDLIRPGQRLRLPPGPPSTT